MNSKYIYRFSKNILDKEDNSWDLGMPKAISLSRIIFIGLMVYK